MVPAIPVDEAQDSAQVASAKDPKRSAPIPHEIGSFKKLTGIEEVSHEFKQVSYPRTLFHAHADNEFRTK